MKSILRTGRAGFLLIPLGRTLRLGAIAGMAAAVGVTAEMASKLMRDHLANLGRAAAVAEAEARSARLRSSAGTTSRTLLPVAPLPSTDPVRPVGRSLVSLAGPSAPTPRDWTGPTGGQPGSQAASSIPDGNLVNAASGKRQRVAMRRGKLDGRDRMAVESGLSFCEERAARPQSTPGYQKAFLGILVFLATLGTWPVTEGQVSPSTFKSTSTANPEHLDGSLCDYFDYLYFSGAMAHEAEKAKAAALHYLPTFTAAVDLPRTTRALAGFRKIAPGASRFPLPWEILGAMIGWMSAYGHGEMALAMMVMFVCYLRPSELMGIRFCDVVCRKGRWLVNLAPGDLGQVTKTGQQDETVFVENKIFTSLGEALMAHIKDLGRTLASAAKDQASFWTFSSSQLRETTSRCAEALGLPEGFCLYMARHGGVTCDILQAFREWLESKIRGRWHSDTTLKRYCKQGLVARYLAACPKSVVKYGEQVMDSDQTILDVITESKILTPPDVKTPRPPKKVSKRGPLPQSKLPKKLPAPLADAELPDDDDQPELPPAMKLKVLPEKAPVMKRTPAMKKAMKVVKAMKVMKVMKAMKAMKVMKVAPKIAMKAMKVMKARTARKAGMKVMKAVAAKRKRVVAQRVRRRAVARRPAGRR